MMVSEEKIMQKYSYSPLKGVGLMGTFGLITSAIMIPLLYYTFGINDKGGYFDAVTGFYQIINTKTVFIICLILMVSMPIFNWFGIFVTNVVSASSRSTIDSCR
ncbi:Solute carrier family 35 member F6 [Smittium mucronatum]|uniref:Solute carrier family 35 member F6 n=1 Tax=Smittium mucronatum TaxID=133383 RepID=A0A1R0GLW3_9FUNG|nr:Solute carrier family 35 member F6 [Smittium mucronatum]